MGNASTLRGFRHQIPEFRFNCSDSIFRYSQNGLLHNGHRSLREKDDNIAYLGILTGTAKIRNCFAGSTNQQFARDNQFMR
jgi:hypothetical protein